jgi:hypothetical protein
LNVQPPTVVVAAENEMLGVLERPKVAMPVGPLGVAIAAGVQFAGALKSIVPATGPATVAGLFQVAF